MKKRVLVLACLLLSLSASLSAQINFNWNEWFRQKKTHIKYQLDNIAHLQVYIKLLKDGYKLVQDGTHVIEMAKNGELGLHELFYLSLKLVNPRLRTYPAVSAAITDFAYISRRSRQLLDQTAESDFLSSDEQVFVAQTMDRLSADISESLDRLMVLLTDNQLELNEQQRRERLDQLAAYVSKRSVFIQTYYAEVMSVVGTRIAEHVELSSLRKRY